MLRAAAAAGGEKKGRLSGWLRPFSRAIVPIRGEREKDFKMQQRKRVLIHHRRKASAWLGLFALKACLYLFNSV
jgi:hypothetical protein